MQLPFLCQKKKSVSDKPSVTWGVTSVAGEDVGVGTSTINSVRKQLKRKQQPLTEKTGIYGQEYDCWQSSSSMAWRGIIPDQAALAQVKYESDSVGSYWANKAASHCPCTAHPRLCEVGESFESGRSGKRSLLLLPG